MATDHTLCSYMMVIESGTHPEGTVRKNRNNPSQLATSGSRSFSANIEHSGMVNCSSCTITVVTTVTGDIAGVGYLTLKGEPKRRWMLA